MSRSWNCIPLCVQCVALRQRRCSAGNPHTCISQEFSGFQNFLGVNSRLVVVHLGGDDVDDAGGSSSDGAGRAVKPIYVPLLQGDHTLIHILQDVVLCNTREKTKQSRPREQNDTH